MPRSSLLVSCVALYALMSSSLVFAGDPLPEAWSAYGGQTDRKFGHAVSSAGDVNGDGFSDFIVGSPDFDDPEVDEGGVQVLLGSASGVASIWNWEPDVADTHAGFSVALAGDVNGDGYSDVAIGAPGYSNGEADEGAVYVFHGSPTGLGSTPDLVLEPDHANASFGHSVATAGDVNGDGYSDLIVGAPFWESLSFLGGVASVYLGSASGLATTAVWSKDIGQFGAQFGDCVSTAGDVNGDGFDDIIVGARSWDDEGIANEGRAFVYQGTPSGVSVAEAWVTEGTHWDEFYGEWVSTAGDVNGDGYSDVVVGTPYFDADTFWGPWELGRAYVYHGGAGGLSSSHDIDLLGPAGSRLGARVGTAGDVDGDGFGDLFATAVSLNAGAPALRVYYGSASGIDTSRFSATPENATFAIAAAAAGDVNGDGRSDILVGFPEDYATLSGEGRVTLYYGAPDRFRVESLLLEGDQVSGSFGNAVSSAGDVDGDGYEDLIVGAQNYDNGETDEGAAYLYRGTATGLDESSPVFLEVDAAGAYFGHAVAGAGDVNGDGFDDVLIGAPEWESSPGEKEGRAYVYHGSATGIDTTPDWFTTGTTLEYLGSSVDSAGDVNGDGFADVIVGGPGHTSDDGRAVVHHGSDSGLESAPGWAVTSPQADARFGFAVSTAGDVNGDGFSDVLVGAPDFDDLFTDEGRVYLYLGTATGLETTPSWTSDGGDDSVRYGYRVACAGDVNGDGLTDIAIASPFYPAADGRVYVFYGSPTGLSVNNNWSTPTRGTAEDVGWSLSAGDWNGDGYSDLLIGGPRSVETNSEEGAAWIFPGSASGLSNSLDLEYNGSNTNDHLGTSVAFADVDGDGLADPVLGVPEWSDVVFEGGQVQVVDREVGSWNRAARQLQPSAMRPRPIGILGLCEAWDAFNLKVRFQGGLGSFLWATPGPVTAYLEWEVKRLDTPFDGTDLGRSPIGQSVGATSVSFLFDELADRVGAPDLPHRWRARFVFEGSPLLRNTPWFSARSPSWTEARLRFSPVPRVVEPGPTVPLGP